jgi:CHASE3 domain sensor protein
MSVKIAHYVLLYALIILLFYNSYQEHARLTASENQTREALRTTRNLHDSFKMLEVANAQNYQTARGCVATLRSMTAGR